MDYSSEVRRRFAAPARAGKFPEGASGVVAAAAADRSLNVWIEFEIQARDGVIEATRFRVFGCPHTVAAADRIAEWLEGRGVGCLDELDMRSVAEQLEVPRDKLGKLLRIEDAVRACLSQIEWTTAGKGSE